MHRHYRQQQSVIVVIQAAAWLISSHYNASSALNHATKTRTQSRSRSRHTLLTNYSVSQKRDPDIIDCNFKKD